MLRLDMQLTRFKTLEFNRLFPLLCSTRFWGQPGEISLFVSCFFSFAHTNNLQFEIFWKQNVFLYVNPSVQKLQQLYIQTLSSISFG